MTNDTVVGRIEFGPLIEKLVKRGTPFDERVMPPPDMQLNLEAARKLIQAAAEIERLTARPLMLKEDLPNVAGFKFIGFDADGNEHECEVRIDPIGCYSVYRIQDDEPFFMAIVAWARHSHDHPN